MQFKRLQSRLNQKNDQLEERCPYVTDNRRIASQDTDYGQIDSTNEKGYLKQCQEPETYADEDKNLKRSVNGFDRWIKVRSLL